KARSFFGFDSSLAVLAFDEGLGIHETLESAGDERRTDFLEGVFWPTLYKPFLRAALVAWSVPSLVSSLAWPVDATGNRYRFTIATWRGPEGTLYPEPFRARVRVTPSSLGRAQMAFAPHRGMK